MSSFNGWLLLAAGLLAAACPAFGVAGEGAADPELAWAKRVTAEFFEAGLAGPDELSSDPKSFLSPELVADLKEKESAGESWKHPVVKLAWQYRGARFVLKSADLSPSKSEAVLTGELQPGRGPTKSPNEMSNEEKLAEAFGPAFLGPKQDQPADVTLWLAKDADGRWAIRFIRAKIRPESGKQQRQAEPGAAPDAGPKPRPKGPPSGTLVQPGLRVVSEAGGGDLGRSAANQGNV